MTIKKEKPDLSRILIDDCKEFSEILAEKLKRIGYIYIMLGNHFGVNIHEYYTQDGKIRFIYNKINSSYYKERFFNYQLIINGKNKTRRFMTAINKEIENNNLQTNGYLYRVESEFYAETIFQEIKKEEARYKKEEKKLKQKLEISKYNSDEDIQELFEKGLKSKNINKSFKYRKDEDILKNPAKQKGKIDLVIKTLNFERNASLDKEEMIYSNEFINFIMTIDNGIIIDDFFYYTKKSTFNGVKVKDVEKIKKIIEVINNHAEKIEKEESSLENCNIKYLMFWKKYLFEDIKKILGE